MKPKRKPKVVEAQVWALLDSAGTGLLDPDCPHIVTDLDDERQVRPDWRKAGLEFVHLTPADPLAKLKADVVRAAMRWVGFLSVSRSPVGRMALSRLIDSVEKLQKVKP